MRLEHGPARPTWGSLLSAFRSRLGLLRRQAVDVQAAGLDCAGTPGRLPGGVARPGHRLPRGGGEAGPVEELLDLAAGVALHRRAVGTRRGPVPLQQRAEDRLLA